MALLGLSKTAWSVLAVLFLALGLFGSGFGMGYKISEAHHEEAEREAQVAAMTKQKEISDGYAAALNEANLRQQALFDDFASLRNTHISLRESIQNSLPGVSTDAELDAAVASGELFAACSERYADLAEKADKHVHDIRTLQDAWNAVTK